MLATLRYILSAKSPRVSYQQILWVSFARVQCRLSNLLDKIDILRNAGFLALDNIQGIHDELEDAIGIGTV